MSKNNFFYLLTSNNFRVRIQNLPRHKTVAPFWSVHSVPAFDSQTQQDEVHNRFVFRHCSLCVTFTCLLENQIQYVSLNWLHAWVCSICSLRQVCRGSCISVRFPRLLSNLVVRVVVSAKKKTRLDLFFRRINWLFVSWLLKDSSLKEFVLVVTTYFPLTVRHGRGCWLSVAF